MSHLIFFVACFFVPFAFVYVVTIWMGMLRR